jgi:hypothetical protein
MDEPMVKPAPKVAASRGHIHTKDDFARRILDREAPFCNLSLEMADSISVRSTTVKRRARVAECASKILRKGHGELTIGLGTY